MKIVYMGTPDFAVGPLKAMIQAGHEITAVVTQPDKQKGRGKAVQYTPVKECALAHHIPVFQPTKIKEQEAVEQLKEFEADIFVVAAFGQILSKEILDMPKYGSINIHASLLPKYRGAAPIQWAIIEGEKETGVTIMQMDEGLDTGDMLTKTVVPIAEKETGESLFDKLCEAGSKLIVETLPKIESGSVKPVPQNSEESSYAKMLTKTLGHIDFQDPAQKVERLIRGLNSWPSAYTYLEGKTLKIWQAEVLEESEFETLPDVSAAWKEERAGKVLLTTKESIYVRCGTDILGIQELQLEGKKKLSTKEFLLGRSVEPGVYLGKKE